MTTSLNNIRLKRLVKELSVKIPVDNIVKLRTIYSDCYDHTDIDYDGLGIKVLDLDNCSMLHRTVAIMFESNGYNVYLADNNLDLLIYDQQQKQTKVLNYEKLQTILF